MAPADLLNETRQQIAERLKEIRPLVGEYQRLEAAAAALDAVSTTATPPALSRSARRSPARSTAPARERAAPRGHRGRPKGSGTRRAEALAIVKVQPGITIPEIAEKMGIKQNYLYRVLPALAEDRLVVKEGRGWKLVDAA